MSRSRKKDKDLRIRVIGLHDTDESLPNGHSAHGLSSIPRGSVIELSLNDLIESDYTDDYSDENQPLWIQVENATPKELARIGEHFGLHPLTVEGIQTRHTREKLEIFQNYLFLVFHSLHGGAASYEHKMMTAATTRPPAGSFAAATLVDPFDVTRAQAAQLAGRDTVDQPPSKPSSSSSVHEGSRLLAPDKAAAKYYGAQDPTNIPARNNVTTANTATAVSAALLQPSPHPPRRHKSQLSISQSPSSNNLLSPQQAGTGRTPSPQPSPGRAKTDRPAMIATHADRFLLPYPLGMGPDDVSPEPSSDSSTSGASDTSCSDFDDQSVSSTPASRSPRGRDAAAAHKLLRDPDAPPRDPNAPSPPPVVSAQAVAALARESEPLRTSPIKLVVFPHLVLSFHSSNLDTVGAVRHRLSRVYSDTVESTAWIIHALLDAITDSLLPVVNATAAEVDATEELIYVLSGSEHRDLLKRMGMTRRRLSFLRQRLWSKKDILMSLIGKDWALFLAGVSIPYLRDVYDHVVTMLHKVEAASDLLIALQNTYLANVQIDVAEASNDANAVMKNLTAVGAIILPMQLVASLWGMNCEVPFMKDAPENTWQSLSPFLSICLGMLVVTILMVTYFKKADLM